MNEVYERRVVIGPPKADDGLDHTVCCHDDDGLLSFCGFDVSDAPWYEGDASCVVCADLDRSGYCPAYGRCAEIGEAR